MAYLITGATGDVGSKIVACLLERGERPRLFVRDASKARSLFGDRVDIVERDLGNDASLRRALEGVDKLFLVNNGPQIPVRDEIAADAAKAAGVRHLVKLSSMDVQHGLAIGAWHERGEAAIRASGIRLLSFNQQGSCRIYWRGRERSKPKGSFVRLQARAEEPSFTPATSPPLRPRF
jgi:uncharacterized protein YbjT (DUF2867 family)